MSNVTVIGIGYVGLVQAVCLAELGHQVTCVDIDPQKIALFRAGTSPIHEPGIESLLARNSEQGRLSFVSPDEGWPSLLSDVTFVAVGTPMAPIGAADLSYVRAVVTSITKAAVRPMTIVMKSTVPQERGSPWSIATFLTPAPRSGTCRTPSSCARGKRSTTSWSRPHRAGRARGRHRRTAASTSPCSIAALCRATCTDRTTDVASAEMIKYASNAFLSTKSASSTRSPTSATAWEPTSTPSPTASGWTRASAALPARRRGLRWLVLPQGHPRARLHLDPQRLPVRPAAGGHRRQQASAAAPRPLPLRTIARCRGARSRSSGSRSSPTRTTCASPLRTRYSSRLLVEEGFSWTSYDPLAVRVLYLPGAGRRSFDMGGVEGASAVLLPHRWAEFVGLDWARVESVMADPKLCLRRPKRARCGCSAGRRTELCRHRTPRGPQERLGTAGRPGSHWTEPVDDPPQAAVRSGRYPEYEADSASSEGPHKETRNDPTRRT